ncbi:peptidylprolyl isomerase [Sphingomicrobium sp. XHP0235]|uniref:peptidylprolyl isomerase n=1 Tax=Sphingomicrobium aquimarinum TaxID=3133971 RepID=UPI0031FEF944
MTTFTKFTGAILALGAATFTTAAAHAQQGDSARALNIPDNVKIYGQALPPVVKATAIVNGEIITQTDIDQRVALSLFGSDAELSAEDMRTLQQQTLRNLIDETLQSQAAKAEEIALPQADIDNAMQRIAERANMSVEDLITSLEAAGSSRASLERQIRGELSWYRLQDAKISSGVTVGEEEIDSILAKLEADKGQTEYQVGEIFLSSTPATDGEVRQQALQVLDLLRQGVDFRALARQYSEASHAAVGGLLGWVRPDDLPGELGAAVQDLTVGSVSIPIKIPGGYSILALQDKRTILTADPRNSVLSLKQVAIPIRPGQSEAELNSFVERFSQAAASSQGCGSAERLASDFGGRVLTQEGIVVRDLPPALQAMVADMQIGQATRPFGSIDEALSVLVMCGREDPTVSLPSRNQIEAQKLDERVAMRARRYLRDLRRDAIIDFR